MRNAIFARLVALRSAQPHDADFGMASSPMAPRRTSPHHMLPPSPQTRWVVVALLALPVVLAAPSDRPARAAGVGRPVAVPQNPELATLRQRSAEAERRLIAATAAYEVAEARLAQSVMRALSQRRKADDARQQVEVNQQRVDALLRSSYENAVPPGLSLLSAAGDQDAGSLLDAAALAYRQAFGGSPCLTDSYRSYAEQVRVYQEKPSLAAVPGTSNHGWGLAVDLCGGLQSFGTPQQSWMRTNAGRYGWYHPGWAERGGSRPEPWHWEYGNS